MVRLHCLDHSMVVAADPWPEAIVGGGPPPRIILPPVPVHGVEEVIQSEPNLHHKTSAP